MYVELTDQYMINKVNKQWLTTLQRVINVCCSFCVESRMPECGHEVFATRITQVSEAASSI